ncbi:hypothetical protein [Herbaspirillum sp. C9C3]|uniref:hypothetical protein n=1 Tax=Herbaspirillum sp. C9C3 TaxID=2735271 RepID=UPI0015846DFF|nr:hypothetical protein [Herbaspirillum sp. C9C3]NUT59860.1 hypothetical protein [Herbaspirillum sp. C9C3]
MKSKAIIFLAGMMTASLFMVGYLVWEFTTAKIHRLSAPLQLRSYQASNGVLPSGATLYYDTSLAEGVSRYKIYVNIDRMPLPLENLPDPTMIAPLEAAPFRQEALLKLLRNHPLTRKDLDTILSTGYLTKDEIKEVLSEFVASK